MARSKSGNFQINETPCTDVPVTPTPVRTIVEGVYGDYHAVVGEMMSFMKEHMKYPPVYIHIDDKFCRLHIPGQCKDVVTKFLESRGF